jgi:hypothetical protein
MYRECAAKLSSAFLCALSFNLAPLRELYFSQRRKEEKRKAQRKT